MRHEPLDDSEPSPERQKELRSAYEGTTGAFRRKHKRPYSYDGVLIRTRGELRWILASHGWSGEPDDWRGSRRIFLTGAILSRANLAGIHLYMVVLADSGLIRTNFSHAWLMGADLMDVGLSEADLSEAELVGARICHSYLHAADLHEANLYRADLSYSDLSAANLAGAHLIEADLRHTNLSEADLRGADLRGARIDDATLRDCVVVDAATELPRGWR